MKSEAEQIADEIIEQMRAGTRELHELSEMFERIADRLTPPPKPGKPAPIAARRSHLRLVSDRKAA